jgi:hypothetical protein
MSVSVTHEEGFETHFQLTQAATTPRGSQMTSFDLYIIKKLVSLFSLFKLFSPCLMVHLSFSTVTNISPRLASTIVLPESRHAILAMISWLLRMNFNIVFSTLRRCMKLVCAHLTCAAFAFSIARSMPSAVEGLTRPSASPVAGA